MVAVQDIGSALRVAPTARLWSALSEWIVRRRRYRRLLGELRDYPAAELRELGIDPFRLETLARQAAGLRF